MSTRAIVRQLPGRRASLVGTAGADGNWVEDDNEGNSEAAEARAAADIVVRIRAGDREAERLLVERYQRGLLLVLRRRADRPEDADDLCQEVLLRVLEKLRLGQIEQPERLAAYIHGFARKLWSSSVRKKRPETNHDAVDERPADGTDALSSRQREETTALVQQYLQEIDLVPRDRDVLVRLFLYDQDRQQICAELDISRLHFNRVLHRAKNRMRQLLGFDNPAELYE